MDNREPSTQGGASKAATKPTIKTRYFLDTEFIEAGRHSPIKLISIGIVSEDGREYYAESCAFDHSELSPWLKENVLPHLGPRANRKQVALIAKEVREFIGESKPEFWGYYADYDWVVFCQIFGSMIDLPKGWPMYCRDIKQLCDSLGNPKLPENANVEHNALSDAKWNEKALQFLLSIQDGGSPVTGASSETPPPSSTELEEIAREAAQDIANCYATSYMSVQGNVGCWGEKHVPDLQSIILTALTAASSLKPKTLEETEDLRKQ